MNIYNYTPIMHIKVSHESPIEMLWKSRQYNDYDYCLVHLMETREKYKEYFLRARNFYNREVFLDTSVFELGTSFDPKKYMNWAEHINPNLMIIPDVLEDYKATIQSWEQFTADFKDRLDKLDAMRIGVVQGKTYPDIRECYRYMSQHADVIAISFDMSYFVQDKNENKLKQMCYGRPALIQSFIADGIWNWLKPHHLLGCSLPQEFSYYVRNNIHNIRSVDTSNPIVHGMHDIMYNSTFGLKDKVKMKLADMIDHIPTTDQQVAIEYNIDQFAAILRGEL